MKSFNKNETKESLLIKGKKNALSGILYFIINTFISLIINPILVNYFGTYYFGLWKSIEKFVGFASIADGQGAQALKWTIANLESSSDTTKKQRYIASSLIVWILFIPILMVLIGLFIYFSPFLIQNMDPSDYALVYSIILLLGLNLIITPLFSIPESLIVGTNQGYIVNFIKALWLILTFVFTYLIVFFEYTLKELALSILLITFLRGLHYLYIAKKRIFWIGLQKPKKQELKKFFNFSSWKLVWAFNARFLLSSEVIFISMLVNPSSVSQYIFSSYIPVTGILLSAIVTSAFNPGIGKLIGNKNFILSQHLIFNLREFVLAFSIFIGATTLLLNKSFVFLWVGEDLYLGNISNLLIVLIMIQLIIIRNEAFLIDLSLDIKKKVLWGILSIIGSIILVIILYNFIYSDINSIFIAILLGRMTILYVFPLMTNKMIKKKDIKISKSLVFYSIFILTLGFFIGNIQIFKHWYELFLFGIIEILILSFLIYSLLLSKDNKLKIKSVILKIYQKYNIIGKNK